MHCWKKSLFVNIQTIESVTVLQRPTPHPLTGTACTQHTFNWLHIHHSHAV